MMLVITGGDEFGQERNYATEAAQEADKARILSERMLCFSTLNHLHVKRTFDQVVTDGWNGAAITGALWAETFHIRCVRAQSDVARFGRRAPFKRREALVELIRQSTPLPGVVLVSFPGGDGELAAMARAAGCEPVEVSR